MTLKRLIFLFSFFSAVLAGTSLSAQDLVSDVDSRQSGDKILITYRLSKKADVSIYFSVNGGRTYSLVERISGDVGENVSPGKKTAVWNVLSQVDELSGDVVFKVEAFDRAEAKRLEKKSKRSDLKTRTIVSYIIGFPATSSIGGQSAYTDMTMGVMVGMVKRFGWYVNGQFAYNSKDGTDSILSDSDDDGGVKDIKFNSVAAGAMLKIIKPMDIYVGPAVIWGKAGLDDAPMSYTGFAVDTGVCLSWSVLTCSVGVTVPVISGFNPVFNIGIGFYF